MKTFLYRLLVAAALSSAAAGAQTPSGDADAGQIKAYTCTGCHGIPAYNNVYPTYRVPKLGGQNYDYLIAALKSYRSGERDHATMQAQAGGSSDQDIADIASYFVSLVEEQSQ